MNKVKTIIIAGTPGVGKTTIAKKVADKINALHIDLSELAMSKKLFSHYDDERDTYVIDENRVVEEVLEIIRKHEYIVIDTHYPEILPKEEIDMVIILRLHPRVLEERLKNKNWVWEKIRENVLAEILSVVAVNAVRKFGEDKVYEIDTTNKSVEEVVKTVLEIIDRSNGYKSGLYIDWLTTLSIEEINRYSG